MRDRDWEIKALEDGQFAIAVALLAVATAIDGLHEALRSDHPLQGENFEGLASAIGEVADAIKGHE
jgi:hypothetical protein